MAVIQFERILFVLIVTMSVCVITKSLPVLDLSESDSSSSSESNESEENVSRRNRTKDLYVVKAVVYEIGILTDSSDEDDSTDFESQERVDLTFFNGHRNGSHIDLGRVPLPIQTNISGQVLTGIAPVDIGAFSSPEELLRTLPITGTIVNITHSDTGYFELKTSNLTDYEKPHILNVSELKQIPEITQSFSDLTGQLTTMDNSLLQKPVKQKVINDNLIKKKRYI